MNNPKISVITPASRGVKTLKYLLNDFKNQTFRDFEHIIVYDGEPSDDVRQLMAKADPQTRFTHIKKDRGNMKDAPGTNPRNYGISITKAPYCCFFDDDDRCSDLYLEHFVMNIKENSVVVQQMACQESRIYKNGSPDNIVLIPEIDLPFFPVVCHIGTPCFAVPTAWAKAEPWRHEPEHDYRFIKRICDRYHPVVQVIGGMAIDVDGLVLRGMKDFVSIPPFYRK